MRLATAAAAAALVWRACAGVDALAQAHQPPKVEPDDYVWQHDTNPYSGDPDAIVQGRRLYRSTCYICHLGAGGRGPNLRKSSLRGKDFVRIVLNGKKGTQMPAWKGKMSEDETWKVLAFIEAPSDSQ